MGETDPAEPIAVVSDAGPVLHLDEVECLDLLTDFSTVWIPDEVAEEIRRHRPEALERQGLAYRTPPTELRHSPDLAVLARTLNLGKGETAGLAFTLSHPALLFLTDDAAARLAAKALGLRAFGTLGVLLRAIRRQHRTAPEVAAIVRSLPFRSTLHLRRDLLDSVLREIETSPL